MVFKSEKLQHMSILAREAENNFLKVNGYTFGGNIIAFHDYIPFEYWSKFSVFLKKAGPILEGSLAINVR